MHALPRRDFLIATSAVLAARARTGPLSASISGRPLPSPSQLEWQRDELALFLHFGVNTFTDREWGDGTEHPSIFAPAQLDARQWARSARGAGFKTLVLTAKHHDGFCLWPSRTTRHSVAASPWRGGQGDLVREFVDACRAEGLKPGLYCSPWDRNSRAYGDSPRYNELYCDQITELLTSYGPIHEVWFDGANGEGPTGKRQIYDWPRFFGLVKRLQPASVIFSDAGPDIRWIGNEKGQAGDPNWSTVNPATVPYPGASGDQVLDSLQHGDPTGSVWRPGESDVSIRPGWFYHPAEDEKVRTPEQLVELYFTSVGRNSKLLLNVPPTREGLLHSNDVARLDTMRARLAALFETDHTAGRPISWRATSPHTATAEIQLARSVGIGLADLAEPIEEGQRVARYHLEGWESGRWLTLSRGTTIGYRKLDRFQRQPMERVRLTIEDAVETPRQVRIRLFSGE